LNQNLLERQGSSYVAKRAPDFLFANDPWFRGLTVKYGPDGGVYVSDWCDTGECHNYEVADQRNGRIFKVVYGKATPFTQNLNSLNDRELVALQNHENEFIVNHARRILHERKIAGKLDERILPALMQILTDKKQPIRDQLRALWCLYLLDGLGERSVNLQTAADDLRAWCIRLMLDRSLPSQGFLKSLAELAKKEKSPSVRLALASSLQRLPVATRWQLAENLVLNSADEKDAYLPLMIWYGIEPLAGVDLDRTVKLFESSTLSVVRQNLARRIVTLPGNLQENLNSLVNLIPGLDTKPKRDLIIGMREGLKGQRRLPMPEKWLLYYSELTGGGANPALEAAMQLTAQFGDPAALEALRRTALNERADAKIRQWAVSALMSVDAPDLGKLLKELFNTPSEEFPQIRGIAIRGFANLKEPEVAELLIKNYSKFSVEEKADAIAALASRKEFAHALLDAIDKNLIPRADLSLFVARQILAFQDQSLESKLTQVWGQIRSTSKERVALTKKYRELLTPDFMKQANVARGRKLYAANCASCHKLFDEGGNIGPELTGSQRTNLDYVLENILDPAAVVAREYQLNEFRLFNGRLVSGIIKQENDKIVTVQTQNEILNLAKEDIESRKTSKTSMMPEGIFDKLKDDEIRDLIRYLQSRDQVSLPND
jgi:putative heme-binding domain-containing protein